MDSILIIFALAGWGLFTLSFSRLNDLKRKYDERVNRGYRKYIDEKPLTNRR